MYLSFEALVNKFPFLKKFHDQKWIKENAINPTMPFKEVPLHCALLLIQDTLQFLETTKFNNSWEENFSTKVRLRQIEDLLMHLRADTLEELTKSGNVI